MAKLTKIRAAEIVDELGALKATMAPLIKRQEELEDILKLDGKERYEGKLFNAIIPRFTQTRYIAELLKQFVKPATLEKCSKEIDIVQVRVNAKKKAVVK